MDRRLFDRLLEAAPDGFIILDSHGHVRLANARAESLFGLRRKSMIQSDFRRLLAPHHQPLFTSLHNDFLSSHDKPGRFRGIEIQGLHRTKGEFPIEISLSKIETPEGPLTIIDITDITERKTAEQTIRDLNADLENRFQQRTTELTEQIAARRQLEEEILQISEREQRRIGQDLHDDLGQQLAGAWMMAEVLQRCLEADNSAHSAAAKKMGDLLQKALAQTRTLARGLYPVAPEQGGFARALESLAAQSSELFSVRCRFECRNPTKIDDDIVMMHLYRIAQEAVSNAVKHGKAKQVTMRLTQTTLTIVDDGIGIQAQLETEGMGLRIMRYRAEMIGGRLKVENGRKLGFVVKCILNSSSNHAKHALLSSLHRPLLDRIGR